MGSNLLNEGGRMGRKLAVTLAVALLMFVFAPMATADLITVPGGRVLVIPDGSQITSVFLLIQFPGCGNTIGLDFQFQGGTGSTFGCTNDVTVTDINFTVPVTDLSITALITGLSNTLFANGGFPPVFQCDFFPTDTCPETGMLNLTLGGPISSVLLSSFMGQPSGIESMSFTADAGDPPTSSLVLLGFGLMGLLVSFRRKVAACP